MLTSAGDDSNSKPPSIASPPVSLSPNKQSLSNPSDGDKHSDADLSDFADPHPPKRAKSGARRVNVNAEYLKYHNAYDKQRELVSKLANVARDLAQTNADMKASPEIQ